MGDSNEKTGELKKKELTEHFNSWGSKGKKEAVAVTK